jgi:formylglycine-generating enzyme required for sulfatase activity
VRQDAGAFAMRRRPAVLASGAGLFAAALVSPPALADVDPRSGVDFVTISSPGNAPINDPGAPSNSRAQGRGRVDYEYKIGRTEVTTAQWVEFLDSYARQPSPHPFWSWDGPIFWGGSGNEFSSFRVGDGPNAARLPVTGITWRMAAMYCNWLHNGKGSSPNALVTGAYDTTTWGDLPGNFGFTDAPRRLPGAQYYIPTLDEQLKATYYDPHRFGQDQPGYWTWRNSSTGPGISGPPGVGTTSNAWVDPNFPFSEWSIPLGAYPSSLSPWGLLDTSGGASEWLEDVLSVDGVPTYRRNVGSNAGPSSTLAADSLHSGIGGDAPYVRSSTQGLRIGAIVPAPGCGALGAVLMISFGAARPRRPAA